MAVSVVQQANALAAAGGATVVSAAFTPTDGNQILVIMTAHENTLASVSISDDFGEGWTWNERIAFAADTNWSPDIQWRAWSLTVTGTPGSGQITITTGGSNPNGWNLIVAELTGVNTTTNDGVADSDVATSGGASTGPLAGTLTGTSGNAVLAVGLVDAGTETALAPDSPLSEIAGGSDTAPQLHISVAFSATEDSTPSFDWTNSLDAVVISIEIAASTGGKPMLYYQMNQRRRAV